MNSTYIKFIENCSLGLDPGYDAGRFSSGNNSFAVYTHLVGDKENLVDFDIQCLPANEYDHVIPVGLNAPENTELVFRAEVLNFSNDVPVYLEDKVSGTFTALHESGSIYTVTLSEQNQGVGRFFLHAQSLSSAISTENSESVIIIIPNPYNNYLRIIGHVENGSQITIYDMTGRQILNRRLKAGEINDVEMSGIKSGAYFVLISSSSKQFSKKIIWSSI